jgi:hypothetical protein
MFASKLSAVELLAEELRCAERRGNAQLASQLQHQWQAKRAATSSL